MVHIRVLGTLELERGGEVSTLRAPHLRAILARLAMEPGCVVSSDVLAIDVVGDHDDARRTVKTYVWRLRRELGEAAGSLVRTVPPGYVLAVDREAVDAHRFERLVRDGRETLARGHHHEAADLLAEALSLWRGTPYADVQERAFDLERMRLEELRLVAIEAKNDAELAAGGGAGLVPQLETLVRTHPLRERLWAQLMVALFRSGRQADALRAYQQARSVLVEELGVEPGKELRDIEAAIIQQHDPMPAEARETSGTRVRILLVDDHPMWRDTIRNVLSRRAGIEIVGEAGTVAEAIDAAGSLLPDVVLMDLDLPDGSGADAAAAITSSNPAVRVLMLTASDAPQDVVGAVRAGAMGYVVKSASGSELADAVERAAAGDAVFTGMLADIVLNELRRGTGADAPSREQEVLLRLAEGATVGDVGRDLGIGEHAARQALRQVLDRLQAGDRRDPG